MPLIFEKLENLPTERLTNRYYKASLGLNKHAPNISTRCELGVYPVSIFILKQAAKYWTESWKQTGKLSYYAYLEDMKLHSQGLKTKSYIISMLHKDMPNPDVQTTL